MFYPGESPIAWRSSFIDARFKEKPPEKKYSPFTSLLSILSLALMTYTALYSLKQLKNPDVTPFVQHRHVTEHLFRPGQDSLDYEEKRWRDVDSFKDLFKVIPCFFPNVFYAVDNPPQGIIDTCNLNADQGSSDEVIVDDPPLWVRLPFYFTVWGAGMGGTFELVLLLLGKPFEFDLNPFVGWVRRLRLLNLAFVTTSTFLFSACMTVPKENVALLTFMMYFLVAVCFALAPALFSGGFSAGGYDFMPPTLLAMQLAQTIFVLYRGTVYGGCVATTLLAAAPLIQIAALLTTTATPLKSTGFHLLSTLNMVFLYISLLLAGNDAPSFAVEVEKVLEGPESTQIWPFIVGSAIIGWHMMMSFWPTVYENFRSELSYNVWSLLYYVLVGAPSQPLPYRLSLIFQNEKPETIKLEPYSESHRYDVIPNLAIPAIRGDLPQTVEANAGSLVQLVAALFKIISRLDYFIPQADVNKSIKNKPRLAVTSDGEDAYPSGLFNIGLMKEFPEMGKHLQRCPQPAIDAFKSGEILAWLCQYGIGNTFLKAAVEKTEYPFYEEVDVNATNCTEPTGFVLDFRYLESYEYKEDYEPYGGIAYFTVNKKDGTLKTTWLVTPREKSVVLPTSEGVQNQAYRRAEAMIYATLHFAVIAGKHLAHIHMTYNLLEVTAHNSFDVKLNPSKGHKFNAHPVRLYLYMHLFSHGLAEELTTEHLVQEGAVFSQIFAMKYESLCSYLSRQYNDFEFADDEDYNRREKVMEPLMNHLGNTRASFTIGRQAPYSCGLEWEKEYYEIFHKYARRVAAAIYGDNEEEANELIRNDEALQGFYTSLECVMNKMPTRYEEFKTFAGLTTFLADATQHLVVRHQFYGTTAVSTAMDPRIGSTQIPVDGGTPALDEWRSLAFVALATAYANFVHLVEDEQSYTASMNYAPIQNIFDDATPVHDGTKRHELVGRMKRAWELMQKDLKQLEVEWTEVPYGDSNDGTTPNWKNDTNYMFARPLPSSLHTGPGY